MYIDTRTRKIWRDMMARRGRTFLVSAAIFIGVAGTITLFSLGDILTHQLETTIDENKIAMVNVLVTFDIGARLDSAADLANLTNRLDNLQEVQAAKQATIYFKVDRRDPDYHEANLISYSAAFDELVLEPMDLREGAYPSAGANEVVVELRFARRYGIEVGDKIYFRVRTRFNYQEEWTVSGIVFHPYVLSPSNTIYARSEDNTYLTGTRGFTVISSRFDTYEQAHREAREFSNLISNTTSYIPVFTQRQDPAQNPLTVGAQRLASTLNILSLITLFVSGFIVVNVISSIISEQRRQIGAMKAIGATRLDIFFIYTGLAFMYGLLGVIPGIIVGIPLGYYLAAELAGRVNTVLEGFTVSYPAVFVGVSAGLAVPILTALIPVIDGTRISILEAMSDSGIRASYKPNWLGDLMEWLPIPFMVKRALRNLALKKVRLLFTILTLAVAVGAFMGIWAVFNSVNRELGDFLDNFKPDIAISPNVAADPEVVMEILQIYLASQTDESLGIERVFRLPIEIDGYQPLVDLNQISTVVAYGFDVDSDLELPIASGETLTLENAEGGIVISSALANTLGKGVGDTVTITLLGNSTELEIVGISNDPLAEVWVSWQTLARAAGYEEYINQPNLILSRMLITDYASPTIFVTGIDSGSNNLFEISEGHFPTLGEAGVAVSSTMAERGGYALGDELSLQTGEGAESYPIVGIFEVPAGEETIPVELVGMHWEKLAELEGRDLPLPETYLLDTAEEFTATEFDRLMIDLDDILFRAGIPTDLFNFVGLLEALSANLRIFQAILGMVALLIGVVGALGLLSTLSMSVYERQREIGVMRSVGASSSAILLQFMTEGLMVGFIAWVVGLPIGYLLSKLILDVTGLSDTIGAIFSVQAALIGLLGMLVITALASLLPSLAAAHRTVSDILRYQ